MSKIKKVIIFVLISIFLLIPFSVSAQTGTQYTVPCSKPEVTDTGGYIEVLYKMKNGSYCTGIYTWTVTTSKYADVIVNLDIDWYDITIKVNTSALVGCLSVCYMEESGHTWYENCLISENGDGSSSGTFYYNYAGSSTIAWIESFHVYGNYNSIDYEPNYNTPFSIVYSDTSGIFEAIKSMAESNAQIIVNNQNENTDKIVGAIEDSQEKEKQESSSTGNSAIDSVTSAVPNYANNLLGYFNTLTKRMIHNNMTCFITMPSIKIPAIKGLWSNEIVLSEAKTINIAEVASVIPIKILYLVRYFLTLLLIIYCFKELYSIIQYIMTLKGGGLDE